MSDPFIAEMRIMPFGYAPRGWARCDGATMAISQNQALFSILKTTFGGDGVRTYQLPDLRGRVPLGAGKSYPLGQFGGEETHMLLQAEVLGHTHAVQGLSAAATSPAPADNVFATASAALYAAPPVGVKLPAQTVQTVGGMAHPNLQPYQVMTMAIALQGVYPSNN